MKNITKILSVIMTLLMVISVVACSNGSVDPSESKTEKITDTPSESKGGDDVIRIAYTSGPRGDNGYNDENYQGVLEAKELYDFEYVDAEVDNTDAVATEALLRGYAEDGIYDLIIQVGNGIEAPVMAVAKDYPEQRFAVVDSFIEGFDNIMCLGALDGEQGFLSGVLSGILTMGGYQDIVPMTNEKGLISYAIGTDSPVQRADAAGYMAGVRYVNPECDIDYTVVGSFRDPVTAKEISTNNIKNGADIATGNCGGGALGILEACKESGAYFIATSPSGVDYDYSVATAVKYTNMGVRMAIAAAVEDTFEPGIHRFGIAEGYCEISLDDIKVEYPPEILEAVDAARQAVIDGSVVMPGDISELDDWASKYYMDVTEFGVKTTP